MAAGDSVGRKGWNAVLLVTFAAFLFLPLADMAFEFAPKVKINEKRSLAPLPELTFDRKSLEAFPERFEKYYDDHFGFRELLARAHSHVMVHWLGTSPVRKVLLGEEDWLFYGNRESMESFRRLRRLTGEERAEWVRVLGLIREWVEGRGSRFVVIVAPNKSSIYSEFMPKRVKRREGPSLMDQFIECCREAGVDVVDGREVLLREKGEEALFPRTDTHWNDLGSYYAYRKLMGLLTPWYPRISPVEPSDLQRSGAFLFNGDLSTLIGLDSLAEKDHALSWDHEGEVTMFEGKNMESRVLSVGTGREDLPTALMFRDSFATRLLLWMPHDFRKLTAVFTLTFDPGLVRKISPDIVVFEIAERNLTQWTDRVLSGAYQRLRHDFSGTRPPATLPGKRGGDVEGEGSPPGTVRFDVGGKATPE